MTCSVAIKWSLHDFNGSFGDTIPDIQAPVSSGFTSVKELTRERSRVRVSSCLTGMSGAVAWSQTCSLLTSSRVFPLCWKINNLQSPSQTPFVTTAQADRSG